MWLLWLLILILFIQSRSLRVGHRGCESLFRIKELHACIKFSINDASIYLEQTVAELLVCSVLFFHVHVDSDHQWEKVFEKWLGPQCVNINLCTACIDIAITLYMVSNSTSHCLKVLVRKTNLKYNQVYITILVQFPGYRSLFAQVRYLYINLHIARSLTNSMQLFDH